MSTRALLEIKLGCLEGKFQVDMESEFIYFYLYIYQPTRLESQAQSYMDKTR